MEILIEFFNSPENSFWSKFGTQIISLIGIIISALIAIRLFNRGLQKERNRVQENRDIEKRDKKEFKNKELQGLKDQMEALLSNISKAVDSQIEEYLTMSFDILNHPYEKLIIVSYTHENLKRLLSIDSQRIWEVFSSYNIENKQYINLYACLDYFNKVFQKAHEDVYEGNGQTTIDLMNQLIKIRTSILDIATNYIYLEKGRNSAYSSNTFWVMINTIVLAYYKDNDGIPNIKLDYDMLINKFKAELLKEEFKYFPTSDEILKLCKVGGDTYFSITQINKDLANDLIRVSEKVQDMNIKLLEIGKILKAAKNDSIIL